MSKECQGCGAVVSDNFHRVFYPDDSEVLACIHCSDKREHGFEPDVNTV